MKNKGKAGTTATIHYKVLDKDGKVKTTGVHKTNINNKKNEE
jgi:hypothetical protein